jgi:bzd-type benzoyl-CoA reductase N subunit
MMGDSLETLSELRDLAAPFPENKSVKEWRRQGGKVIGYVCIYVPEEMLYAAGVLPFRVSGDNEELELKKAEAYLYINTCSFARTGFQLAIEGQYDFLEGLVTAETCDGARRLHDVWLRYRKNNSFMHIFYIPRKWTERAHKFYRAELEGLRRKLGQFVGKEIDDEALSHSIRVYNRSRELLHRLYEMRKRDNPPITGAETLEVVKAGMRIPREQYNKSLEKLVDELERTDRQINKKVRLMILGSILHNSEWITAIESLDAVVVTDELCTGTRYFWNLVDTDLAPIEALDRYYLNRPPCARFQPSDRRFGHIYDMIDQFKVHGVVSEIVRYCVPYGHDKPLLKEKLTERDIPILELDLEYGQGGTGQIRTRAEAFVEMLQTKHFQS